MSRKQTQLPRDVVDLLVRSHGLITTAEAEQAGVHVGRLRRLVDAGLLTQFARGCYVDASRAERLDEWAPARPASARQVPLTGGFWSHNYRRSTGTGHPGTG